MNIGIEMLGLLKLVIVLSLVTASSCSLTDVEIYSEVVISLFEFYRSSWIVLLYGSTETFLLDDDLVDIIYNLNTRFSRSIYPTSSGTIEELRLSYSREKWLSANRVPLHVLFRADNITRKHLDEIIFLPTNSFPIWLIFIDKNFSYDWFDAMYIPFDVQVMVANVTDNRSFVEITEIYHVAPGQETQIRIWGHWSVHDGIVEPSTAFFVRRSNLEGLLILASVAHQPPGTLVKKGPSGEVVEVYSFIGMLWEHLAETLNFSTTFVMPLDNSLGAMDSTGHFTNGMMGQLARGEVEVALGTLSVTAPRRTIADFSTPILESSVYVFSKIPDSVDVNWKAFVKPFSIGIWVCLVIIGGFVPAGGGAVCRYVVARRLYLRPDKTTPPGYFEATFFSFAAFCQQGSNVYEGPLGLRVLLLFSYYVALVLYAAYCSSLISSLSIRDVIYPFRTIEEFVKHGRYHCGLMNNSSEQDMFGPEAPHSSTWIEKFKTMIDHQSDFPTTNIEGLYWACTRPLYAFIMSTVTGRGTFRRTPECDLFGVNTHVTTAIAFATKKEFPYLRLFNNQINSIRSNGVLQRAQKYTWPDPHVQDDNPWSPVILADIIPILVLLMGGMIAAILVLISERIWVSVHHGDDVKVPKSRAKFRPGHVGLVYTKDLILSMEKKPNLKVAAYVTVRQSYHLTRIEENKDYY